MDDMNMMTIGTNEYKCLSKKAMLYDMLIDSLFKGARYNGYSERLDFADTFVEHLIPIIEAERYDKTLASLKKEDKE